MEPGPALARGRRLDEIAEALPQRASALSRLFLTRSSIGISRTEVGVLYALSTQPRRITELAGREGVTQPAITLLVNRLQERGWVDRAADSADRRAVLVELTAEGRAIFDRLRAEYRALLHEDMATLPDEDVETLARAVEILDGLIARLEGRKA
ncbi:MAG: MarR family transcriptional regulator [Solirubrobacterales bacterium]|nr:MarR family transcriptional regulator [Solirubrobacterales bacterium]MBV9917351.1 MarR family transcriptional regulator [Solirubrobacterales bacterium]